MRKTILSLTLALCLALVGTVAVARLSAPTAHAATCSGSYYEIDNLASKSIYDPGRHTTVTAELDGKFDNVTDSLCLARSTYSISVDAGQPAYSGTVAGWICISSSWTTCGSTMQSGSYGSFSGTFCCGAGASAPWVSARSGNLYAVAEDGVGSGSVYWAAGGPY